MIFIKKGLVFRVVNGCWEKNFTLLTKGKCLTRFKNRKFFGWNAIENKNLPKSWLYLYMQMLSVLTIVFHSPREEKKVKQKICNNENNSTSWTLEFSKVNEHFFSSFSGFFIVVLSRFFFIVAYLIVFFLFFNPPRRNHLLASAWVTIAIDSSPSLYSISLMDDAGGNLFSGVFNALGTTRCRWHSDEIMMIPTVRITSLPMSKPSINFQHKTVYRLSLRDPNISSLIEV